MPTPNLNYPYSYLHSLGGKQYALSVILKDTIRYSPKNDLAKTDNGIRWIAFDETNGAGTTLEPHYDFSMSNNEMVIVTTLALGKENERPTWQNNCCIYAVDAATTPSGWPTTTTYLPHVYLTKDTNNHTKCTIHIAVPAMGKGFLIENPLSDAVGERQVIRVFEQTTGFAGAVWESGPREFTRPMSVEYITVEVYSSDNRQVPKAKGTIRHSAADNKPFPLLRCAATGSG